MRGQSPGKTSEPIGFLIFYCANMSKIDLKDHLTGGLSPCDPNETGQNARLMKCSKMSLVMKRHHDAKDFMGTELPKKEALAYCQHGVITTRMICPMKSKLSTVFRLK